MPLRTTISGQLFLLPVLMIVSAINGCSEQPPRLNVLLVTVDTLRADYLGCYGDADAQTPHIDALAAQGVLFENAFASVPSTLPSHTTIMTGLYPHQHGVRDNAVYYVPKRLDTLAEIFARNRYETAAFISAYVLDHRFGIDQGFDLYDDEMDEPLAGEADIDTENLPAYTRWWVEQRSKPFERAAGNTVGATVDWLQHRSKESPFFCWVHLFDPHMPYIPPGKYFPEPPKDYTGTMDGTMAAVLEASARLDGRIRNEDIDRMTRLYAGEIAYADEQFGRLMAALEASGLVSNTLIVLTADHGEAFGEHLGLVFEHNASVYDEVLHVPLIIADPRSKGSPRRNDLASLVDIAPTVLDRVGLPVPGGLPGRSLFDPDPVERSVYFEALCSRQAMPNPVCYRGCREPDWKLFGMFEKEGKARQAWYLYDPVNDPHELNNRVKAEDAVFREKLDGFKRLLGLSRVNDREPTNFWPLGEDRDLQERMKALGYIK